MLAWGAPMGRDGPRGTREGLGEKPRREGPFPAVKPSREGFIAPTFYLFSLFFRPPLLSRIKYFFNLVTPWLLR
ncbi:hypothetical protein Taro_031070 [Colocasia esculenta]|uniref:Uncharacterized protein n=1 Tax=Colocasia esculenta TaxID=4460 RepID=A0A843VHY2_COLES|nr:hypothetical protein [Colocasia esculenta]